MLSTFPSPLFAKKQPLPPDGVKIEAGKGKELKLDKKNACALNHGDTLYILKNGKSAKLENLSVRNVRQVKGGGWVANDTMGGSISGRVKTGKYSYQPVSAKFPKALPKSEVPNAFSDFYPFNDYVPSDWPQCTKKQFPVYLPAPIKPKKQPRQAVAPPARKIRLDKPSWADKESEKSIASIGITYYNNNFGLQNAGATITNDIRLSNRLGITVSGLLGASITKKKLSSLNGEYENYSESTAYSFRTIEFAPSVFLEVGNLAFSQNLSGFPYLSFFVGGSGTFLLQSGKQTTFRQYKGLAGISASNKLSMSEMLISAGPTAGIRATVSHNIYVLLNYSYLIKIVNSQKYYGCTGFDENNRPTGIIEPVKPSFYSITIGYKFYNNKSFR